MAEQGPTDRAAWEGEMFRLPSENVKDYAIFVMDRHRHVLSWSKGAEQLLGFSEEEIVGRRCDCFFTPEDVERGMPHRELEQALATGRGEDDRRHMRKDGSRFRASGAVTPLEDEAGFDHHLTKPVDPAALHALLDAIPPMPGGRGARR